MTEMSLSVSSLLLSFRPVWAPVIILFKNKETTKTLVESITPLSLFDRKTPKDIINTSFTWFCGTIMQNLMFSFCIFTI